MINLKVVFNSFTGIEKLELYEGTENSLNVC